jgi:hypothetical protein
MTLIEWLDHGGPSWLERVDPRNVVPYFRLRQQRRRERAAWRRAGYAVCPRQYGKGKR